MKLSTSIFRIVPLLVSACVLYINAAEVTLSGSADADFAGGFVKDFESPSYTSGLEIDLTTNIKFTEAVSAQIYTTMVDGVVPAAGAGATWPAVAFDGAAVTWNLNEATLYMGDVVASAGGFGYYFYKRSYAIIPETFLRGAGVDYKGLSVYTGMDTPGAAGVPTWQTFVKYSLSLSKEMTLTPSLIYQAGAPGLTPITAGVSFDGPLGPLGLSADLGFGMDGGDNNDPTITVLVEPSLSFGKISIAGAVFFQSKGTADTAATTGLLASNTIAAKTGAAYEDMFLYIEPGISINDKLAFGLPLEYHEPDMDVDKDQSIWVVPTLYVYPAENVEWWLWAQAVIPDGDPQYFFGSEIIFSF